MFAVRQLGLSDHDARIGLLFVIAHITDIRTALLIMSLGLTASTIGGWLSPLRTATTVVAPRSGFGNESSHHETEAPQRRDGRSQPPA